MGNQGADLSHAPFAAQPLANNFNRQSWSNLTRLYLGLTYEIDQWPPEAWGHFDNFAKAVVNVNDFTLRWVGFQNGHKNDKTYDALTRSSLAFGACKLRTVILSWICATTSHFIAFLENQRHNIRHREMYETRLPKPECYRVLLRWIAENLSLRHIDLNNLEAE